MAGWGHKSKENAIRERAENEHSLGIFWAYRMAEGDDLGVFLTHYVRLWKGVHLAGVTHADAIYHLLNILPKEWYGWAREVMFFYVYMHPTTHELMGHLSEFVSLLLHQFLTREEPRPGPYIHIDRLMLRTHYPQTVVHPTPAISGPPILYNEQQIRPTTPRFSGCPRGTHDFEAGTSRPAGRTERDKISPYQSTPVGTNELQPLLVTSPVHPLPPRKRTRVTNPAELFGEVGPETEIQAPPAEEAVEPVIGAAVPAVDEDYEEDPEEDPAEDDHHESVGSAQMAESVSTTIHHIFSKLKRL